MELTKNEITKLAEVLADKSFAEAEFVLSLFGESEREVIVDAILDCIHIRRARAAKRAPKIGAKLLRPRLALHLRESLKEGKAYVKRGDRIFAFNDSERAFAFCECCRRIDELIAGAALAPISQPRVKITPLSTYRKNYGEPIVRLYPAYVIKKVTICIETE